MWLLTAKLHIRKDQVILHHFRVKRFSCWNLGPENVASKEHKPQTSRSGYDKKAYFAAFSIEKRTRCRVMVVNTAVRRQYRRRSKMDWSRCNR
jgi:hypothetical protein